MYYENYILINIDIPNYEEIKKKYFDNQENKIVLLNDNYSIQFPFEYFTPVMYSDEEGTSALLWALFIITAVFTVSWAAMGGVSSAMSGGDAIDILEGIGKGATNGKERNLYYKY